MFMYVIARDSYIVGVNLEVFGFMSQGLRARVQVQGSGLRVQGSGLRVQGQGSGSRVKV